ncbi:hypothetical protein ANAPH1_00170 [Anaplasma phagocytophilum]|nr:hypothetical protein ANAPH1_00170 [Anaplasma phagocytophilum]
MVFSSGVSFVRSLATALALSLVTGAGLALLLSETADDVGQFVPSFRVFFAKSLKTSAVVAPPELVSLAAAPQTATAFLPLLLLLSVFSA